MSITFTVDGMSCGGCVASVTRAIQQADSQATVSVDLPTGQVVIVSGVSAGLLKQAIEDAGYDVTAQSADGA